MRRSGLGGLVLAVASIFISGCLGKGPVRYIGGLPLDENAGYLARSKIVGYSDRFDDYLGRIAQRYDMNDDGRLNVEETEAMMDFLVRYVDDALIIFEKGLVNERDALSKNKD